jgi:hypothetical protein
VIDGLFRRLPQPHARSSAVLGDELDAGRFEAARMALGNFQLIGSFLTTGWIGAKTNDFWTIIRLVGDRLRSMTYPDLIHWGFLDPSGARRWQSLSPDPDRDKRSLLPRGLVKESAGGSGTRRVRGRAGTSLCEKDSGRRRFGDPRFGCSSSARFRPESGDASSKPTELVCDDTDHDWDGQGGGNRTTGLSVEQIANGVLYIRRRASCQSRSIYTETRTC